MTKEAPVGVVRPPQAGVGWLKVATTLGEIVPLAEMESIWLFAPIRHEDREWGTAVISRRAGGGRRRIYTASYIMVVGGPERGQHKVAVEEVGEGPEEILHEVIAGVQERAGDSEPPLEILPETWFGEADDESATEG